MSSTKKIIIGILTVMPIFCILFYAYLVFSLAINANEMTDSGELTSPDEFLRSLAPAVAALILGIVLTFGTLIYYIIDIVKNPKFQDGGNNKLIWILVVVLLGTIGMIVYFFSEIMPRKELPPLPPNP